MALLLDKLPIIEVNSQFLNCSFKRARFELQPEMVGTISTNSTNSTKVVTLSSKRWSYFLNFLKYLINVIVSSLIFFLSHQELFRDGNVVTVDLCQSLWWYLEICSGGGGLGPPRTPLNMPLELNSFNLMNPSSWLHAN